MIVYRSVLLLYAVLAWLNLNSSGFLALRLPDEQASPNKWTAGKRTTAIHLHGLQNKNPSKVVAIEGSRNFDQKKSTNSSHFSNLCRNPPPAAWILSSLLSIQANSHESLAEKKRGTKTQPGRRSAIGLPRHWRLWRRSKHQELHAASRQRDKCRWNRHRCCWTRTCFSTVCVSLLRIFFTPLVLGTIIIEGKQQKRTSQFVGLVFHNNYFLGIKGKQQKGIESKLENAHALCLHTLAPCSIQRRRASAKRRQAVHMCQGPRRAIPGSS